MTPELLLSTYGLPGLAIGVMAWLIRVVVNDAKGDRRACSEERLLFFGMLQEHATQNAAILEQIRDSLSKISDRLALHE